MKPMRSGSVAPDAHILAKPFRAAALEDAVRAALAKTD